MRYVIYCEEGDKRVHYWNGYYEDLFSSNRYTIYDTKEEAENVLALFRIKYPDDLQWELAGVHEYVE